MAPNGGVTRQVTDDLPWLENGGFTSSDILPPLRWQGCFSPGHQQAKKESQSWLSKKQNGMGIFCVSIAMAGDTLVQTLGCILCRKRNLSRMNPIIPPFFHLNPGLV
jgi:hypothetical protein